MLPRRDDFRYFSRSELFAVVAHGRFGTWIGQIGPVPTSIFPSLGSIGKDNIGPFSCCCAPPDGCRNRTLCQVFSKRDPFFRRKGERKKFALANIIWREFW